MESDDGTDCSSVPDQSTTVDKSHGGSCEETGSKLVIAASIKKQDYKPSVVNGVLFNSENGCNGDGSHSDKDSNDGDISASGRPPDEESEECRILSDNDNEQNVDKIDNGDDNKMCDEVISDISSPHQSDKDDIDEGNNLQNAKDERTEEDTQSPNKSGPDEERCQVTNECIDEDSSTSVKAVLDVCNDKGVTDEISSPLAKATSEICSDKDNTATRDVCNDTDGTDEGNSTSVKAVSDVCIDTGSTDEGSSLLEKVTDEICNEKDVTDEGSSPLAKATSDVCSDKDNTDEENSTSVKAVLDVSCDKGDTDEGSTPEKAPSDVCNDEDVTDEGSSPLSKSTSDIGSDKDNSDEGSSTLSMKAVNGVSIHKNGSTPLVKDASDVSSDKNVSDDKNLSDNKTTPSSRTRTCKSCSEHEVVTCEKDDLGEGDQFECSKCQELSVNSVNQTRTSEGINKEQCPMCNLMFESSEELDDHLLSPESCKNNKDNMSTSEAGPLSPTISDKPSECASEDNNNDNACTFSAHKIQSLTLDGSVVDEMEDRDQELQRLSEEADSMDEALREENDVEEKMETEESLEQMENEIIVVEEDSKMEDDPGSSSQVKNQEQTSKDEKLKPDAEDKNIKLDVKNDNDDRIEEEAKVIDQVFLSKDSHQEVQPEIVCHEITEPPVPVAAIHADRLHEVQEKPVEKKEEPGPVPTAIKPVLQQSPTAKAAISQSDVVDITDSEKDKSEKTSGKGGDGKSESENAKDDESGKSPGGLKRRISTGNETLDQDIVEMLQDTTKSSVRVTRSMRKPKEDPVKTKDAAKKSSDDKKSPSKTQSGKSAATGSGSQKSNKLNSSDAMEIKDPLQSSDGSLVLQVPAPSVQSGAKLIITIPENNSTNTPPGRYLITVPPANASSSPGNKQQVVLKASPLSPKSPTTSEKTPIQETKFTSDKQQSPAEKSSQMETEATQILQLKKTMLVAKQTKKVYVKELEEMDNVIFECPKCKQGFPNLILVQLHMEDCCHHPPTQKPTLHMRIPTEILLKFFDKEPAENRDKFQCVCCGEILSFRRYRVGKYYPSLAKHFSKHTYPPARVVNYTQQSVVKKLTDALTVHSKQAVEWCDHMVPPFSCGNQPVSSKTGMLEGYLCTSNKLHQESLLLLEYDSDELDEEIYSMRKKKEKKKKKGKNAGRDEIYVCNWKRSIVKEEHNIVEVTEVGTPKSAFPNEVNRSGSLKHSILHSPSKALAQRLKDSNQKSGKKRKGKTKKEVSKQLFVDDNINRRRSPRKGGADAVVLLSLPQKRNRRERSLEKDSRRTPRKPVSSDDDIILISSEDDTQQDDKVKSTQSKEKEVQKKTNIGANQTPANSRPATPASGPATPASRPATPASRPITPASRLIRQGSMDDESSRGSFSSIQEQSAERSDAGEDGVGVEEQGDKEDDERPPSRGSSIICISSSNEEEESSTVGRTGNMPKMPDRNLSKAKNMIPEAKNSTTIQKAASLPNAANKQALPDEKGNEQAKAVVKGSKQDQAAAKNNKEEQSVKTVNEPEGKTEEGRKRLVPEAHKDEDDEVMVLSDTEEEDEEDGVDLNSDNYDPILLDKHQVKTYFQMSKEEQGIYDCSLGGCSSCDCVAESDLFEHLCQHIHVEKVHPQKRSKTILFKGKVVPQYLKLTKHQIWAHFCSNIVVDSEMEICDEYMQQYKQCRWGSCKQRVWTKYGRLSHHLRSHLRFTQIDDKRYQKMRDMRKLSSSNADQTYHPILENISKPKPVPIKPTRERLNDGDEVVCLPEDVILQRYKFGKSPSKNVRGIFSCLSCTFSHHLDSSASAVTTVKRLACHLKQHLPQPLSQNRQCLITPKAMKQSTDAQAYAKSIRTNLLTSNQDLENMRYLPDGIIANCFDLMKMKVVEPAADDGPILNSDGVLYRCLYSGCLMGVVGDSKSALLKHIKEHKPAVGDVGSQPPPGQNKGLQNRQSLVNKGQHDTANRKRKPSPNRTSDGAIQQLGGQSKQRRLSGAAQGTAASSGSQASNSQPSVDDDDDDDVVEVIEVSSQDSNPLYSFEEQSVENVDSSSQDSVMSISQSPPASGQNVNNLQSSELPEWTANNRGVNSVTGIEPSRSNPSRNMNELRQIPNDVIVCSMPDVEAFFCEHIVKYSSFMPSLSDKVTFGKPSYSCPECKESGLRGVALKQHLENHIGKTIKWKALIRSPPMTSGSETELESPVKYKNMMNVKNSGMERVLLPSKMRLNPKKLEGRSEVNCKHQVKMVGQGIQKARHGFKSVLGKIMQRERNIRWGKSARSPIKRFDQYSAGNCGRNGQTNAPIRNLTIDLTSQVNQGQSSTIENADTNKQFQSIVGTTQHSHNIAAVTKSFNPIGMNRSHNTPVGMNQSHNALLGMKQSHNAPVRMKQSHNAPVGMKQSHNAPVGMKQSHNAGQSPNLSPVKSFSHAGVLHRSPKHIGMTQSSNIPMGARHKPHSPMGAKSHSPIVAYPSKQANLSSRSQPCEVIDLIDDDPIEIGSVGSEDLEMENMSENEQNDKHHGSDELQGDDLFLTIDDILKDHFIKEEKQKSRKGINGMNFVVVKYKCRRCTYATLTVLDVPEHVAFHIKRKVILKIKMDK